VSVVSDRLRLKKGKLMEKKITWVSDLTTLWEDAFGQYSVHSLVGALFANVPQEVIDRLAQEARDEIRRQTLERIAQEEGDN
jgi:hypothetical protein